MIVFEQATMAQHEEVVRFYSELIDAMRHTEFRPDWKMGVYPTAQILENAIKNQTLYLVHWEDNLVGVMTLNHNSAPEYDDAPWQINAGKEEVAVIHALAVAASCQRQGIAGQMVAKTIELCKKNSLKAIRLDVLKKNVPAAKLYLSMGFQYIAPVQMYYEDTGLADFELYELVL